MSVRIGDHAATRILAPMAGYTDVAFRALCKALGAELTVTEMVSVRGLVHGNAATDYLLRRDGSESPFCIQLFGNDPKDFAAAAKKIDCDIIDINMGCPMPKIVKNGDGAALLKAPKKAGEIVAAVKDAVDKPVTVKTRLGYKTGEDSAGELIDEVVRAGASAVTVHGRYAEQRYAGACHAEKVAAIKAACPAPVILSGDVTRDNLGDMLSIFDAVMIGRAALADPCVFGEKRLPPEEIAARHLSLLTEYFDERYTVAAARKFFVHYFKGEKGGKALRTAVNSAGSVAEIYAALKKFALDKSENLR